MHGAPLDLEQGTDRAGTGANRKKGMKEAGAFLLRIYRSDWGTRRLHLPGPGANGMLRESGRLRGVA